MSVHLNVISVMSYKSITFQNCIVSPTDISNIKTELLILIWVHCCHVCVTSRLLLLN